MHRLLLLLILLSPFVLPMPTWALTDPPCGSLLSGQNTLTTNKTCPAGAYELVSFATLDCQGFTLTGPDIPPASCNPVVSGCITDHYGIRVNNADNVTLKNCRIKNFERGLYMSTASFGLITDNVFFSNTRYGAMLTGASTGNNFLRNTYKMNKDEGVHFSDLTAGANLSDSEQAYLNTAEGFYLLRADSLTIQACQAHDNGAPGIYLKNSLGVKIISCTLTNDNIQILNDTTNPWAVDTIQMAP